jgi:DNA mismatch repair protein MutS2
VLPVRSEWKSRVPGIVHDASATGQTVWIEPLEVVELGNAVRESEAAVTTEEARILGALSALVGADAAPLRSNGELLALFDLARAVADVARDRDWLYADDAANGVLILTEASHPLLTPPVVPMSLRLDSEQRVLVITGPNTGGKTVALKAVGLLTAMHHAGLPIPSGSGSTVPPTGNVWADIGDDQSIAQSLSTFSGHLTSIQRILVGAVAGDVVLLDEADALNNHLILLGKDLQDLAALPLDRFTPDQDGDGVTFFNVCLHCGHDQSTSGAKEMIFMKFRSRSSRATGPKIRVPFGF